MFNFFNSKIDSKKKRLEEAKAFIQAGELHRGMAELQGLAAEEYPEAEQTLGEIYEFGIKDEAKAVSWYGLAAAHGNAQAQFCFAGMHMAGKGTAKNEKTAFTWYKKAAEQGITEAQFVLGEFYRVGDIIPQDLAEARKWYGLAQKGTGSYVKAAEQRLQQMDAKIGTQKKAEPGRTVFMYKDMHEAPSDQLMATGLAYFFGDNVPQDHKKAAEFFEAAAEKGLADAQYFIGKMYFGGQGVVKNNEKGMAWVLKAAEGNNPDALFEAAIFYERGIGVERNKETAYTCLKKAADLGHEKAIENLRTWK